MLEVGPRPQSMALCGSSFIAIRESAVMGVVHDSAEKAALGLTPSLSSHRAVFLLELYKGGSEGRPLNFS